MPEEIATTKPPAEKIDKGPYTINKEFFTGDKQGFDFYFIEFKRDTEDEALASYEEIKKKFGASAAVGLFNSAIKGGQRVKAQNELNKLKEYKVVPSLTNPKEQIEVEDPDATRVAIEKRRQANPTLLSLEDCENWKPGVRELTAQGMLRQAAALIAEGKTKEAQEMFARAQRAIDAMLETEAVEEEQETTAVN